MREVLLEIQNGRQWRRLGAVTAGEPSGSISNDEPTGRQVYVFGWLFGQGPGVWRSQGGVDLENPQVRLIENTDGFELIGDLLQGAHEMDFVRRGMPMRIRFRYVDA